MEVRDGPSTGGSPAGLPGAHQFSDQTGSTAAEPQAASQPSGSPIEGHSCGTSIMDPSGRYERSSELLGRGASKEVYKAFDREEGMEVAWNQLKVDHLSEQSAAKILSEIQILTQLDNENIIKFYHSWLRRNAAGSYDVFFITELMTSGTLKNYLQKTKGPLKLKIIKNWCRQILKALHYLHTKSPPIIHRDLKCDNIFINGNNGQAKLGDFGLAVLKDREMLTSVLGTPEFMAPELYEESYNEKVDVYAFGLCLLEMVTKDYPYSECENAAQIYRKVTQGIKPMALGRVEDPETKGFIEMCINHLPSERPTVEQLLAHEFMAADNADLGKPITANGQPLSGGEGGDMGISSTAPSAAGSAASSPLTPLESISPLSVPTDSTVESPSNERLVACQVEVMSTELPTVNLRMRMIMSNQNANKEVKFPFDFEHDTVAAVVEEMIREHVLLGEAAGELAASAIRECIKEPLAHYEMVRTNAPARAEINEIMTNVPCTTTVPHSSPSPPVPLNPPHLMMMMAGSGGVSSPTLGLVGLEQGADSMHSTGNTVNSLSSTASSSVEVNDAELDLVIQDHPEVAALLLRQKKEIELLALFHRREHQMLLRTLRRQIGARSRHDSHTQTAATLPPLPGGQVVMGGEGSLDESQFISKVRHLLYESTGNAAWLPDGSQPPPAPSSNTPFHAPLES